MNSIERFHERQRDRIKKRSDEFREEDHPRGEGGLFIEKGSGSYKRLVDGPAGSQKYIDSYFSEHPEVKKDVSRYTDALQTVKDFAETHPNGQNQSYDLATGKVVDVSSGYCVTFHQNYKSGDYYGKYTDPMYAELCAIAANELKATQTYIGYYGNPELSFNCPDFETAKRFAVEHNQKSVYIPGKETEEESYWYNPDYDSTLNPID